MKLTHFAFALSVLCAAASFASAQTSPPEKRESQSRRTIAAVKTTTPPVIDGDLSDETWKSAAVADRFTDGRNGSIPKDQTIAYLLYDEKYLYVAFNCFDSQPDQIKARETIRDYRYSNNFENTSEDSVELNLDPFRGHHFEDRTLFSLNSLGTRSALFSGGRANKVEWSGEWEGAVKMTKEGWTAEMRIPWKILNYPNSAKPISMGINFSRAHNRTRVQSYWSDLGPQFFFEQDGVWEGVKAPGNSFRPSASFLPYALLSNERDRPTLKTGLDARFTLTPQLTAVGAINPEFGTVEGAVQGIQFSRSERYVPEARTFFLEGGNFFNVSNVNIIGNYFFTNRIPSFDLGGKLYGKVSPKDTLGLLFTDGFGKENDVVAQVRHDFSPTSQGNFFFSQKSAAGDNNTVGVLNQDTRIGKLQLHGQWALSSGRDSGGDAKEAALLYLDKSLTWGIGAAEVTPLFRDANGYIPFVDYRQALLVMNWNAEWRKGFWRSFYFNLNPSYSWHLDGRSFQRGSELHFGFDARKDWRVGADLVYNRFEDQTDATLGLSFTNAVSNRFRQWGVYFQTGIQGDRPSTFLGPQFSVRVFRKLDIAYSGSIQNLDGVSQQHIGTMNYQLSPTRSFGGRLVVQNADTNWYLFYRNSGGKGTNLYVVVGDPNARRFVKKLSLKLVFAL